MGLNLGLAEGSRDFKSSLERDDTTQLWKLTSTLKEEYIVVANDLNEPEESLIESAGIPTFAAEFPGTDLRVSKKDWKEEMRVVHPVTKGATMKGTVTVNYSTLIGPNAGSESEQDPTAKTPEIRWSAETEEQVITQDAVTGEAIQTVPGEPIIAKLPITLPILEVKRIEVKPFNPFTILFYMNHVNSTAFYGAPPGTALMKSISAEPYEEDGEEYVQTTYQIVFKIGVNEAGDELLEETWKFRPLHHGYLYFEDVDEDPIPYVDPDNDQPATINLAEDGTKLAKDADPVLLEFNRFPRRDFNALNLGPY